MAVCTRHHEEDPPAPLKFDRRCGDRSGSSGRATAFLLSGDHFGRICELELNDLSSGGLGAISDAPINPGTVVSVGFARFDQLARRGIVRRCIPCGDGYRIGVEFELGLAA